MRANLARQQDAIEHQHTSEEPSEHHSSLAQDYYTNNSFVGAADIVPAERVYGNYPSGSHIFLFSNTTPIGSQQRAWLNPPTQASGTLRDMMPTKSAYNSEEEHTVYEKSNVLLIGPTGSGQFALRFRDTFGYLNFLCRENPVG